VLRGLETRPADRFPSMDALLAALAADPVAARRRRLVLAGIAGGFVLLAAVAVVGFTRGGTAASACQVGDDELAGVWDAARKGEVRRAFAATSRAHAEATYTRIARLLDGQVADWTAMRREACEATARGRQSPRLLDLRMQCLDRRRDELAALTALFARGPDPDLLNKAVSAAAGLTPIASCADADALSSAVALPDDPAARARVLELHRQLDEVDALGRTGKWKDAVPLADRIVGDARALDHAPLLARALYLLGGAQDKAGDPRAAEVSLRDALDTAAVARDHDLIARAWIGLLEVIGHEQMDAAQALALRESAELAVKVTGDQRLEANLWRTLGRVLTKKGEFAEARREYERALTASERAFGAEAPEVAATLQGLAIVCDRLGDFAESRRHYDRALAVFRAALGDQHPAVGGVLHDIGALLSHQDQNGEARGFYEQALPIFIGSLGPDHPHVATVTYNLGILARDMGDYEAAAGYYQEAGQIYERTLGADHPDTASALSSLGTVRRLQGKLDEGMALYRDALARLERSVGADHIDTAVVLESMALGLEEDGQLDEARAAYDRVLAIAVKAYGPDNPNVGDTLVNLGNLEARRGHHAEAKQHLDRALAIAIASHGDDSVDAGQGHHAIADLLRQQGKHGKALEAYRRALAIFEQQLGADHGYVGVTLTGIGLCELGRGRAAAAIEPLERAVAIAKDQPVDATSLPSAQTALERARAAAR
jgi:serine/threonine-protein kinase